MIIFNISFHEALKNHLEQKLFFCFEYNPAVWYILGFLA